MTNSVDAVAAHLGLHCLLLSVCPIAYGKYGKTILLPVHMINTAVRVANSVCRF